MIVKPARRRGERRGTSQTALQASHAPASPPSPGRPLHTAPRCHRLTSAMPPTINVSSA